MPPKKKRKTGGAAAKPATKSPCAAYFERLDTAVDSNRALGSMLVQGINNDDYASDDEEEDEDEAAAQAKNDAYTVAQVAQLRHIIINKRREGALEEMSEMVIEHRTNALLGLCCTIRSMLTYAVRMTSCIVRCWENLLARVQ